MLQPLTIRPIDLRTDSLHLETVKILWRQHSSTLGFFPTGAFYEYAVKGQILVALNSSNECIGYLLYRISHDSATVVHLCCSSAVRKSGVATQLFQRLNASTRQLRGIGLNCRRDFEVSGLWPKLGFVALTEKRGRSLDGKPLTFWWYDNGHPTLFSEQLRKDLEENICVVMDANVFFDIGPDSDLDLDSEESKSLTADWVQSNIQLCLTEEIFNEIDRNTDTDQRQGERKRAHSFVILKGDIELYTRSELALKRLIKGSLTKQDESDIRQVARAVAAKAEFFVTRDAELLGLAEQIYNTFGLLIIRPLDLIIHLDRLERELEYRPARLAGTSFQSRLIASGETDQLVKLFSSPTESSNDLRRTLSAVISDTKKCRGFVTFDAENAPVALYTFCERGASIAEVSLLRVIDSPLAKTWARYLASTIVLRSAARALAITTITDRYLQGQTRGALLEGGFVPSTDGWTKIALLKTASSHELQDWLLSVVKSGSLEAPVLQPFLQKLKEHQASPNQFGLANLELALWPGKILDAGIPNYIVPIRPAWAKDLFDEKLAEQDLFGANEHLALQQEGIYYRSNYFAKPTAPARLLWYVSYDKGYVGSGQIRGCSRLDEVLVDKPKELYRRFRRLGVYGWKDVYGAAAHDVTKNIMALRFSHSELFENHIPWTLLQDALKSKFVKTQLRAPVQIDDEIFFKFYKMGTQR